MTTKRRVRIVADADPCNPRTDWDGHAGRMLCWHRDYNLGDEHGYDRDDWKRQLVCEDDDDLDEALDIIDNELYEAHRDYAEEV
ncbi:MAG: hypothetical protein ACYSW8_31990, partial [Planctomycetota bacterium]